MFTGKRALTIIRSYFSSGLICAQTRNNFSYSLLNALNANKHRDKYIFCDRSGTSSIVSNFSDISLSIREFKDRFGIIRTFNKTMPDNLGLQNNRDIIDMDKATINPFNYVSSFI